MLMHLTEKKDQGTNPQAFLFLFAEVNPSWFFNGYVYNRFGDNSVCVICIMHYIEK